MNKVKKSGFTLVELVVVIALLGILAAFAMPRFGSLEKEARIATVQGLSGSLRSAVATAHGLYLATGHTPVTMAGSDIDIVNGYPDAATIRHTLSDVTDFDDATNGTVTTFTKIGAPGACMVTYTEATTNGAPDIATTLDNC